MSRYSQINSALWNDASFEDLTVDGRYLYLYLLTCPYSNIAGFYRLPPRQIVSDTGLEETKILPLLLGQKKLWKYDEESRQILIPNYLKYNTLKNDNQRKAINTQLMTLELCDLHKYFMHSLQKHDSPNTFRFLSQEILRYVKTICTDDSNPIDVTIKRQIEEQGLLNNTNT